MWNHTVFVLWGQYLILFCGRWEGGQRFTVVRAQEGIHGQESLCDHHCTYFILIEYSHQTASRSACWLCCHDCSAQGSPLCSWKGRIMGNSRAGYWATIQIVKPFTSSQLPPSHPWPFSSQHPRHYCFAGLRPTGLLSRGLCVSSS